MQFIPREIYETMVGQEVGVSRWIEISQSRIDQFAECTGDRQYIHVDPVRAAASQFGRTVAQGFLTLSMIAEMMIDIPTMAEVETSVNYGLNRLRFISPVGVGSRVRGRFFLVQFEQIEPSVIQILMKITVEIEDDQKPALVAEWLVRRYLAEVSTNDRIPSNLSLPSIGPR